MEWLKKHWEILAATAVGILIAYWLIQAYQANQAQAAQAATDATANADALASAQQLADADYGGYYTGSSGGGSSTGSTIAPPVTSPTSTTPVSTSASSTPVTDVSGGGYLSAADAYASLPASEQNGDYSYSQNSSVANNPNPIYAPGSPQAIALGYSPAPAQSTVSGAISTMLGSGGSSNDTAPVPVQATVPDQSILTHVSDGSIPLHGTAIAKTPTPVELSSLGGR